MDSPKCQEVKYQKYHELMKQDEFIHFLNSNGVEVQDTPSTSRVAENTDCLSVMERFHVGLRSLLSNSQKKNRVDRRTKLAKLLIKEAELHMDGQIEEGEEKQQQIEDLVHLEMDYRVELAQQRAKKGKEAEVHESIEIGIYLHGWCNGNIPPVAQSKSSTAGITCEVIPFNETPSPRAQVSVEKPQKVTPLAKKDSNIINIGEVSSFNGDFLKKIAQFERAVTYAVVRAENDDVLRVVGYAALCMATKQDKLARTIIRLHPAMFPYLTCLHAKGSLPYLYGDRDAYQDIKRIVKHMKNFDAGLEHIEERLDAGLEHIEESLDALFRLFIGSMILVVLLWTISNLQVF